MILQRRKKLRRVVVWNIRADKAVKAGIFKLWARKTRLHKISPLKKETPLGFQVNAN
jgi:hypothetical protein